MCECHSYYIYSHLYRTLSNFAFVKRGSSFFFAIPQITPQPFNLGIPKKIKANVQNPPGPPNGRHGITAHFLDLHLDFGMLLRGTTFTLAPLALPWREVAEVTWWVICFGTGDSKNTAAARMDMAVVQEGDMGLNFAVYLHRYCLGWNHSLANDTPFQAMTSRNGDLRSPRVELWFVSPD